MIKRVDVYIFQQILRALGFSLLALVGMFWLGQIVPLIEQIILRGETVTTFFRLAVLLIPKIIKLMLPIAALIAVVFTMNRMATEGEIMAIHDSGRDPMQILRPVAMLGLILMAFHMLISCWIAPAATFSMRDQLHDIQVNFAKNFITAKTFVSPDKNLYIFADESALSGEMINIFIDDRREEGISRNYIARRAFLERNGNASNIALIQGEFVERDVETGQISKGNFDRLEVQIAEYDPQAIARSYLGEELPFEVVRNYNEDTSELYGKRYGPNEKLGELVDRLAFPFLSFALPILGAIGFLGAPLSRHGYSRIIWGGVVSGLFFEAYIFSMRGVISSNPNLIFLVALPVIALVLIYIYFARRVHGDGK